MCFVIVFGICGCARRFEIRVRSGRLGGGGMGWSLRLLLAVGLGCGRFCVCLVVVLEGWGWWVVLVVFWRLRACVETWWFGSE